MLGLLALLVVSLTLFGFATYSLFAQSQRDRLDQQLESSLPTVEQILGRDQARGGIPADQDKRSSDGDHRSGPERDGAVPYGERRTADGKVVDDASFLPDSSSSPPGLPEVVAADDSGRSFTVGSVSGSTRWRVFAQRSGGPGGSIYLAALPTSTVEGPLRRLLAIELVAAAVLTAFVAAGSSLIMRRGLRPLEQMAGSARSISAGSLGDRVAPASGGSEVGELGLALNTMLDEIEVAFREREATEAKLRQFLADASHELRTPLTSIQGFAELFRLGPEESDVDLPVIMRRIEQESQRMKVLVDDLLLLARVDQRKPLHLADVDLTLLAADACSDAVAADPSRSVTLDGPEPVEVSADADHIRQALANLVSNALRHTPPGSPLELKVERLEAHGRVTIRDHGPGLSDDAMAHAFDRFWQADEARIGTGAGLGLSIVAAIAEEHGGSAGVVNVESGGAAFRLDLPIRQS